jgi:hypothetical protein
MSTRYRSPFRPLHPSFPQPDDGSVQVWRYMDLPRLIAILERQQLILSRADLMIDRFEGAVPQKVLDELSANPETAARVARLRSDIRRDVYISSWHENPRESEAMWRLYCGAGEGVALSTTYAKLDHALTAFPNVQIGRVTYVDYHAEGWQEAYMNVLTPFMYKRASFEHEREIRVLHLGALDAHSSFDQSQPRSRERDASPVIGLEWNIAEAVERLWVSPYAPRWYFDVVNAVLERFAPEMSPRLTWSEMAANPWF